MFHTFCVSSQIKIWNIKSVYGYMFPTVTCKELGSWWCMKKHLNQNVGYNKRNLPTWTARLWWYQNQSSTGDQWSNWEFSLHFAYMNIETAKYGSKNWSDENHEDTDDAVWNLQDHTHDSSIYSNYGINCSKIPSNLLNTDRSM